MNWTIIITIIIIQYSYAFDTLHRKVEKPRIGKCCPFNQSLDQDRVCVNNTESFDYNNIPIYTDEMNIIGANLLQVLKLEFQNNSFAEFYMFLLVGYDEDFNTYLLESGAVYLERKNVLYRWTKRESEQYCIDYASLDEESLVPVLLIDFSDLSSDDDVEENPNWSRVTIGFMLISVICLLIVLVVYAVLPELRNLGGMILMAYVGSLLLSYVFLAAIKLVTENEEVVEEVCYSLTFSIYYLLLSSFFWMNVMSFDIWWTFRGYAKARPIHRRGESFKFSMYALYAWGVPLLMTVATVLLFFADLGHIPWFVKPTVNCFFVEDGKMLYLYMPILILIVCNWVLFTLTAHNIWRLSRNTGVLTTAAAGKPSDHHNHRNRLMVYVKLSVVMGMSWVFEVLSYFVEFMHVQDIYHSLIGLVILLIFVFKRKVYKKLLYKFTNLRRLMHESSYSKRYSTSTADSEMSQDTPLQVCSHPKGVE